VPDSEASSQVSVHGMDLTLAGHRLGLAVREAGPPAPVVEGVAPPCEVTSPLGAARLDAEDPWCSGTVAAGRFAGGWSLSSPMAAPRGGEL
jgi:hypothetical protein